MKGSFELTAWVTLMLLVSSVSSISLLRGATLQPNASHVVSEQSALGRDNVTTSMLKGMIPELRGTLEEDRDDAEAWKNGQPHSFASDIPPPKCPADVSETSPYMTEMVLPNTVHTICDYRTPCDRKGTNLERLKSIRGLLAQTKKHLNAIGVPYAIYGGSAIGQERCRDVLPWDNDCDVVVWMDDVHKIQAGDLEWPYTMMKKEGNYAVPYVVADKSTGFYCDIFYMQYEAHTGQVGMAWPWGSDVCYGMSNEWPFSDEQKKCDKFPVGVVTPFVPCMLNGISHPCLQNQPAYLEQQYGAGWAFPNVTTQPGGGVKSLHEQATK